QIITCLALVAFSFTTTANAQQSKNAVSANDKVLLKGEEVVMQHGKPMLVKDGKATELQGNVVTGNGHLVKSDGTIIMNTGTSVKMTEGQTVTMDGKISNGTSAIKGNVPSSQK